MFILAQIVVVEDDVYMREELIDVLRKAGYDAVPLLNFENAVSQIMALSPDLILLDINLPFHSGFEVCKEIKAKRLGTVLILTARDKLQDEVHALGLGNRPPLIPKREARPVIYLLQLISAQSQAVWPLPLCRFQSRNEMEDLCRAKPNRGNTLQFPILRFQNQITRLFHTPTFSINPSVLPAYKHHLQLP